MRIRDGKNSDPGWRIRYGKEKIRIRDAKNSDQGWQKIRIRDGKSRIRNPEKHPGSAALLTSVFKLKIFKSH
jgi:hypothetical protein